MTFGSISAEAPDEKILAARQRSEASQFLWIVQIGYWSDPTLPAGPVATAARARFERLGLWPYVIAVTYGEEWYEHYYSNHYAYYGLPATNTSGVQIIHAWMGLQHAAVKAATGKMVIWLTGMVHATRPVPANTDIVAIDAYVADGDRFSDHVGPLLLHAETATTLPLVVIPRWFRSTGNLQGPMWALSSAEPTDDTLEGYAAILARPRWIAMWGFLQQSRPWAELVGMEDMPRVQATVERTLGVKE